MNSQQRLSISNSAVTALVSTVTSELQDKKKREKKKKKKKLCLTDNFAVIKVSVATGDMD